MIKFRITYVVAYRPDKEIFAVFPSGEATPRAVANAIIEHEFADVDAPFGPGEALTAEQALRKFAITDVRTTIFFDDNESLEH